MYNDDTIKLLKECYAGCKMGLKSLEDMVMKVSSEKMKVQLQHSIDRHRKILDNTHILLMENNETDKEPAAMAEAMSYIKTNFKLAVDSSDNEIAELLIDGCNMGIKSVSRYLNKYGATETKVKDMVDELIAMEQKLMDELRFYLN